MENRLIKDSQITASTQYDGNHAAIQGRLNFRAGGGKAGGWSARTNDVKQWIQVDFLSDTKVTQIVTQGRNAYNQWVKKYKLQYSSDGVNFIFYHRTGNFYIFHIGLKMVNFGGFLGISVGFSQTGKVLPKPRMALIKPISTPGMGLY